MMYLFITTIFFARFIGMVMVIFGYTVIAGSKYLRDESASEPQGVTL